MRHVFAHVGWGLGLGIAGMLWGFELTVPSAKAALHEIPAKCASNDSKQGFTDLLTPANKAKAAAQAACSGAISSSDPKGSKARLDACKSATEAKVKAIHALLCCADPKKSECQK